MRDFGKAMARIQDLRRKFESLLETARKKEGRAAEGPGQQTGRLQELTAFGANPGSLRMFVYVPEGLPRLAPLVVALHGCSQSAEEYDCGGRLVVACRSLRLCGSLSAAAAGQQSEELLLLVPAGRHCARPRRGAFDPADDRACHCDFRR